MNIYILLFILTLTLVALSLAGLGVKVLLHRGTLKRACAGADPYSGKRTGCACAAGSSHRCTDRQRHPYQPLDVNDNLLAEL